MKASDLVRALKSLEGYHVYYVGRKTDSENYDVRTTTITEVRLLPPNQRIGHDNNVILCDGTVDEKGNPGGLVLRAARIDTVVFNEYVHTIIPKGGGVCNLIRLGELDDTIPKPSSD